MQQLIKLVKSVKHCPKLKVFPLAWEKYIVGMISKPVARSAKAMSGPV